MKKPDVTSALVIAVWLLIGLAIVFSLFDASNLRNLELYIQVVTALITVGSVYLAFEAVKKAGEQVDATRESLRHSEQAIQLASDQIALTRESTRMAHHLELEKHLLHMNAVFLEHPEIWKDYVFKGDETEEVQKQKMLDKMIYWYVNYFCILFWSCRDAEGRIKPEESSYWQTWDAFIEDYVERHPRAIELLSNPKVARMYSVDFISYMRNLGECQNQRSPETINNPDK